MSEKLTAEQIAVLRELKDEAIRLTKRAEENDELGLEGSHAVAQERYATHLIVHADALLAAAEETAALRAEVELARANERSLVREIEDADASIAMARSDASFEFGCAEELRKENAAMRALLNERRKRLSDTEVAWAAEVEALKDVRDALRDEVERLRLAIAHIESLAWVAGRKDIQEYTKKVLS